MCFICHNHALCSVPMCFICHNHVLSSSVWTREYRWCFKSNMCIIYPGNQDARRCCRFVAHCMYICRWWCVFVWRKPVWAAWHWFWSSWGIKFSMLIDATTVNTVLVHRDTLSCGWCLSNWWHVTSFYYNADCSKIGRCYKPGE